MVPKPLLYGAAFLMLASLAIATAARIADVPPLGNPPATPVVESRLMVIDAARDGHLTITAPDGTLIADLTDRQAGFIGGIHRALAFQRRTHRIDPLAPVELVRHADGRLALHDTVSGWTVQLSRHGGTNQRAFEILFDRN
jgi:putative photosynthetic complex assembly protein